MSVTIFHGENQTASYQALSERITFAKQAGQQVTTFEGKTLTLPLLLTECDQADFFATPKTIVIHGLLARPRSKLRDELIKQVAVASQTKTILLWEPKKATAAQLKMLGKTENCYFKQTESIWSLLALWRPTAPTAEFVQVWQETCQQAEASFILAMFIWQAEQLLDVKLGEFMGAPFQRPRLESQAAQFTKVELTQRLEQLLALDYQQKTISQFNVEVNLFRFFFG